MFVLDKEKHYVHLIQVDVEVRVYRFDTSRVIRRTESAIETLFDLLRCIRCVVYLTDFVLRSSCSLRFGRGIELAWDRGYPEMDECHSDSARDGVSDGMGCPLPADVHFP